jgi:hypothetical protein
MAAAAAKSLTVEGDVEMAEPAEEHEGEGANQPTAEKATKETQEEEEAMDSSQ